MTLLFDTIYELSKKGSTIPFIRTLINDNVALKKSTNKTP